jgi:hypothetical protein
MSVSESTTMSNSESPFQVVITKKAAKKRKASTILSTANSDNESNSSQNNIQNSAYYLQKAADNFKLALIQETDQSIQTRIKSLIQKTQLILNAELDSDSEAQVTVQEFQTFKADLNNKFSQISSMISELKSATTAAENSSLDSMQNSEKKTYAQALGVLKPLQSSQEAENIQENASILNQSTTSVRSQSRTQFSAENRKNNSTVAKSFSYRERRLILLNSKDTTVSTAESMKLRDKINQEFQKQLKLPATKPVLAAITKSYKQQNVILMTMSNYNADFLIQHEKIWQNQFKYTRLLKDKVWSKVIAHGISTEIFNFDKGLDLLKEEIKTFNGIEPLAVNWLSSSQNRQNKMHASIVIALDSEETAQKVIKNRLFIAGKSVRTAKFEFKTSEQCLKCQQFGHTTFSCKNLAVCQFCALNHPTRLHTCKICNIVGEICIHTNIKCSNCNGKHTASSKECSIVIAAASKKLNSNSISIDSDSENMETEEEL